MPSFSFWMAMWLKYDQIWKAKRCWTGFIPGSTRPLNWISEVAVSLPRSQWSHCADGIWWLILLRGLFMAHPSLWGCTGCGTNLGDSGATTTAFSIWGALPDYYFFGWLPGLCKGTWAVTLELHTGASTDAAPSDFVRGRPFSKKGFEIEWIRKLKTSNDKPNSINSTDTSARTRTVDYLFATLCKDYINRLNWSLLLFLLYMPIQCLL